MYACLLLAHHYTDILSFNIFSLSFLYYQILALNPTLPLEVAQAYLAKHLKETVSAVDDLTEQTRALKLKTEEMTHTIALDNHNNNNGDTATTTTAGNSSQSSSSSTTSGSSSSSERGGRSTSNSNKSDPNTVGGVGDLSEAHKWEEMKRSMSKVRRALKASFFYSQTRRNNWATLCQLP